MTDLTPEVLAELDRAWHNRKEGTIGSGVRLTWLLNEYARSLIDAAKSKQKIDGYIDECYRKAEERCHAIATEKDAENQKLRELLRMYGHCYCSRPGHLPDCELAEALK